MKVKHRSIRSSAGSAAGLPFYRPLRQQTKQTAPLLRVVESGSRGACCRRLSPITAKSHLLRVPYFKPHSSSPAEDEKGEKRGRDHCACLANSSVVASVAEDADQAASALEIRGYTADPSQSPPPPPSPDVIHSGWLGSKHQLTNYSSHPMMPRRLLPRLTLLACRISASGTCSKAIPTTPRIAGETPDRPGTQRVCNTSHLISSIP